MGCAGGLRLPDGLVESVQGRVVGHKESPVDRVKMRLATLLARPAGGRVPSDAGLARRERAVGTAGNGAPRSGSWRCLQLGSLNHLVDPLTAQAQLVGDMFAWLSPSLVRRSRSDGGSSLSDDRAGSCRNGSVRTRFVVSGVWHTLRDGVRTAVVGAEFRSVTPSAGFWRRTVGRGWRRLALRRPRGWPVRSVSVRSRGGAAFRVRLPTVFPGTARSVAVAGGATLIGQCTYGTAVAGRFAIRPARPGSCAWCPVWRSGA